MMKWHSFFLILFVGLWLVGCGGTEETAVVPADATPVETELETAVSEAPQATPTDASAAAEEEEEAAADPTHTPTAVPAGPGVTTEFEITNYQRVEAEGTRLDDTVACFERLFASGRFVLHDDGDLTYTPADATAIGDCLGMDVTELKGDYEPSDEADFAFEIDDDITQFVGFDTIEIDADGTITELADGAEGTLRIRVYPSSTDRNNFQHIRANYLFNGAMAAASQASPIEYTLTDALAPHGVLAAIFPAPEDAYTVINRAQLEFVTNLSANEVKTYYEQNLAGLGWKLDSQDGNELYFTTDDSRDNGTIRSQTYVQTIVELSLINTVPLDELLTVPLPTDAQIGGLTYSQLYDLPADAVSAYVESLSTPLEGAGWTFASSEATETGQTDLWEQMGQALTIEQLSNDRFENGVRLRYRFAEPIIAVDLEAVRNAVAEVEVNIPTASIDPVNPADYSGQYTLTGSANMAIADELMVGFGDAGYAGRPSLRLSNGTAAGITTMCAGIADGALASRALTDEETAFCTSNGEQVLDFVLARNPIVMLIHPNNDWAAEMTATELATALTDAETWADVNSAWPNVPIERFYPAADSFPYTQVTHVLFDGDATALAEVANAAYSENNTGILDGVSGSEGALGFIAHSGYAGEGGRLTAVSLDGVAPGGEGYLFDQPIILYTLDRVLQANPDMGAFLNFALTDGRLALRELGVALPDEATQRRNEGLWLDKVGN